MKPTEMLKKIINRDKVEEEAKEELEKLGYFEQECPRCKGNGHLRVFAGLCWVYLDCSECKGDGVTFTKK